MHDRIVELIGSLPRAELFARKKSQGWFCIGDEVDGMAFTYRRIQPVSIDLYSNEEKSALIKTLTAELSDIQYPFKFMAMSRPVDIASLVGEN